MIPTIFAIGPWILIAVPLMVIVPTMMTLLTRAIAGAFGDDSFRLRRPPAVSGAVGQRPTPKPTGAVWDRDLDG